MTNAVEKIHRIDDVLLGVGYYSANRDRAAIHDKDMNGRLRKRVNFPYPTVIGLPRRSGCGRGSSNL